MSAAVAFPLNIFSPYYEDEKKELFSKSHGFVQKWKKVATSSCVNKIAGQSCKSVFVGVVAIQGVFAFLFSYLDERKSR